MKAVNRQASRITQGLIEYLKKTNQLGVLPALVKEAVKKAQTEKDPNLAIVTSAVKLTPDQVADLTATLSKLLHRDIQVENRVSTEVIAGLHIKIGDKVIDNTVSTKISQLGEKVLQ